MVRSKKLTDEDIVTLVLEESGKAIGSEFASDELIENRKEALKYYNGDKRGDEKEGSSQVISKDVADTIDSMLTQLLPIFCSDNIVQFEPLSEDDEEQARVESNFVNHVVMEQNNGFMLFETLIKDVLLSKNCYVKVRVDIKTDVEKEKFEGLTEQELLFVFQPKTQDEVVDVTEFDEKKGIARITRTTTTRKLIVEPVAPENFAVSNELSTVDLSEAGYCREIYYPSRSDLIETGYDKKIVEDLPASSSETQIDAVERNSAGQNERHFHHTDKSMQIIEVEDHYIRVDRDGDGVAELLKVVTSNRKGLEITEVDVIPYAAGIAFLMGHRHHGQSIYDKLKEVQDIKTHFLRQWSDNALSHNHNKTDVIEDEVNMEDMISARPDGIRRMDSMDSARDVIPHDIGPSCQNALNYYDKIRTDRTGATLGLQGNQIDMPSNVGNQGVNTLVKNLERVTSLVSKNFSETCVSGIYKLVHTFLRLHFPNQIQARMHGQWNNTNPAQWRERTQVNLSLPPTESEKILMKQGINEALAFAVNDQQTGMIGITTDLGNIYQMRIDSLRLSGVDRPEKYLIDPDSPKSQQAQQIQQQQQVQLKQQAEAERQQDRQFEKQLKAKTLQIAESEVSRNFKNDIEELQVRMAELQQKSEFDFAKLSVEANSGRESDQLDSQTKITIAAGDHQTDSGKAGLNAEVNVLDINTKARTAENQRQVDIAELQQKSDFDINKLNIDTNASREADQLDKQTKIEIAQTNDRTTRDIASLNADVNVKNANTKATTDALKRESDEEIAEAKITTDAVIKLEMESIKKLSDEVDDDMENTNEL